MTSNEINRTLQISGGRIVVANPDPGGVRVYRGIPYAAAPIGALRWREPVPVKPWEDVRAVDEFAPACMQPGLASDGFAAPCNMSEDCLYLNIWTPAEAGSKPLPVLMWIHGGAYLIGSGHDVDPRKLAARGVVVVSINYRLGVLGFLAHPELTQETTHGASGNYGLMDQVAALHWIQENIGSLGGDPSRVTIAGASSGATSVNLLVVSPLARGLFHRAIAQSGAAMPATGLTDGSPLPLELEERKGERFLQSVCVESIDKLRSMPADRLIEAAGSRWETWAWNASIDGWVVPKPPAHTLAQGQQIDVPLIVGWTANEGASMARDAFGDDDVSFPDQIRERFGAHAQEILRLYCSGSPSADRKGKVGLAGDGFIAYPMWSWVAEHLRTGTASVFMYVFGHAPPVPEQWGRAPSMLGEPGAFHGASQPYLFEEFDRAGWHFTEADRRLGDVMASYWANFIRDGDPNGSGLVHWPRYRPIPEPQKIFFRSGGADPGRDADLPRLQALSSVFEGSPGALSYRSMAKIARLVALIFLAVMVTMFSTSPSATEVRLNFDAKIPMRDGVALSATIYQPHEPEAKRPTILTITPYIADQYHETGRYFASHGYAVVVVDERGRGNSDGNFEPNSVQDGPDGHDIVEWITRQPWSNGKVGMWGGSYAGFNQWATLKEFPKGLVTIVPAASGYPGFENPPFYKNIFSVWSVNWAATVAGRTRNTQIVDDTSYWSQVAREHFIAQRPFADIDGEVGVALPIMKQWLAHPMLDAFYDAKVPSPDAYSNFEIPILTVTGQFDGVQRGALRYYDLHMQYGSTAGKANHFLVIGPWNHAGTRKPVATVGGLQVGKASVIDMNQLLLEWYDWTMRGGERPAFLQQRVTYYVTGSEEWRYAPSLEQLGATPRRMFLAGHGGLVDRAPPASKRAYDYDPRDTRPGEHEPEYTSAWLLDGSAVTQLYGAGLVYETEPLKQELLISGRGKAVLWLEMNVPDSDIELILYEVHPDGTSLRLSQDQVRMRYRESLRQPKPMPENHIVRCEWSDFAFFARRLAPGARLRLLIHAPNSIYTEKNYNSGGEVSRESAAVARVAHVTIHQGSNHASFLELPIVR